MQANTTELDGQDRGTTSTSRRGGPIDRDQLRALRALRAVFGADQVQVIGVDDNLPNTLPDTPGTPTPAHAQLRMDGGAS
jgi:hypothetical protein